MNLYGTFFLGCVVALGTNLVIRWPRIGHPSREELKDHGLSSLISLLVLGVVTSVFYLINHQ